MFYYQINLMLEHCKGPYFSFHWVRRFWLPDILSLIIFFTFQSFSSLKNVGHNFTFGARTIRSSCFVTSANLIIYFNLRIRVVLSAIVRNAFYLSLPCFWTTHSWLKSPNRNTMALEPIQLASMWFFFLAVKLKRIGIEKNKGKPFFCAWPITKINLPTAASNCKYRAH